MTAKIESFTSIAAAAPTALLMSSGVAFAETVIKTDLSCHHLKTLQLLDQLKGHDLSGFVRDQIKSGECTFDSLKIGTSAQVSERFGYPLSSKTDVCIVPTGSSDPCQWVSSEIIK